MRELSHYADLLATAEALFRSEIWPAVPPEKRYQAAMIANAMTIASRGLRPAGDDGDDADLEAAWRALTGTAATDERENVERGLVAAIRAGEFDGGGGGARLHAYLVARTRARLRISAPEALADFPPEDMSK